MLGSFDQGRRNARPYGTATRTQAPSGWLQAGFWVCIVIAVARLTLAHILPALAFVGLAPWVVYKRSAAAGLPQRLMFPLGAVVGITAYAMTVDAFGGWMERSAVLVFNSLFLYSLSRAYWYQ